MLQRNTYCGMSVNVNRRNRLAPLSERKFLVAGRPVVRRWISTASLTSNRCLRRMVWRTSMGICGLALLRACWAPLSCSTLFARSLLVRWWWTTLCNRVSVWLLARLVLSRIFAGVIARTVGLV